MSAKIRLCDGREITIALGAKRVAEALRQGQEENSMFVQFKTATETKIWINPANVAAIEDRPDLD